MAQEGIPPAGTGTSRYPPVMGPGARPVKPGEGAGTRSRLMEVMQARSKYQVSVEPETLSLSYEVDDAPRLYRLNFDSMPLQGLSRWWLYGGPTRARRAGILAIDIIRGSETMVQRPMTQQEAEGLTYWSAKRTLYGSMATFACTGLGTYLAWKGRATMKFPFVKAKPFEQYNHFPLQQLSLLKGQTARVAWNTTRFFVWIQLVSLLVTPFSSTSASVAVAKGMATDSRTQGLVHTLKERGQTDLSNIEWPQQSQTGSDSRPHDPDAGQDPETGFQADARGSQDALSMNSLGAAESFYSGATSDKGALDDSTMRDQESGQYGKNSASSPQPKQVRATRPSTSPESDSFFYDDASPTAGTDSDLGTSSPYSMPSSGGGSMWERIRRSSSTDTSSSQSTSYDTDSRRQRQESFRTREPRSARLGEQEAESNEPHLYSSEAISKRGLGRDTRDRESAQREFDNMLERERQQSGSGEYDRGMAAVESGQESGGSEGLGAWERRRGS